MSFAELEGKYPTADIGSAVERRKQGRTDLQCMPPVVVWASMLADEGAGGVRELMSSLTSSGRGIDPSREFFGQIPQEYQIPIRVNHALIVFGLTINSLHEFLAEGSFDAQTWCDRYNLAITGTLLPKVKVGGETRDGVSAGELVTLRQSASHDKTLSFFFETPGFMPNMLRKVLENLGVFPIIQSMILPLYRERAQYLLSPQA